MLSRIRLLIRTTLHLLLCTFIFISVVYTTNLLVISPLSSFVSTSIDALLSRITPGNAPLSVAAHTAELGLGLDLGVGVGVGGGVGARVTPARDGSLAKTRARAPGLAGLGLGLDGLTKDNLYETLLALRASNTFKLSGTPGGLLDSDSLLRLSLFTWPSSPFVLRHGLGQRAAPTPVDERVLLSKLFAGSMRPSNVVPYFYRATARFDKRDVTITTLITSNRLEVFARLVEKYRGPISVTLHIKDTPEHVTAVLHTLAELHASSPLMRATVDLHLVVDSFDRQFNTWRNIARLFARTDFVLMLDIDFFPCTAESLRMAARRERLPRGLRVGSARAKGMGMGKGNGNGKDGGDGDGSEVAEMLYEGRAALVVPAFEYTDFNEGTEAETFPTSKKELLKLVEEDRIGMFHASWAPGHNASEYSRFYSTSPGEIYKVTRYQSAYEPYVIFKKDGPPWCDERFVGYGGNKAACLFEMYLAGVSFYVHSDHFIIHQNHQYEERARKNERKINRKIYADFREEACLRYLQHFHSEGLLGSPIAQNALVECRKIKSLTRTTDTAKFFAK